MLFGTLISRIALWILGIRDKISLIYNFMSILGKNIRYSSLAVIPMCILSCLIKEHTWIDKSCLGLACMLFLMIDIRVYTGNAIAAQEYDLITDLAEQKRLYTIFNLPTLECIANLDSGRLKEIAPNIPEDEVEWWENLHDRDILLQNKDLRIIHLANYILYGPPDYQDRFVMVLKEFLLVNGYSLRCEVM